MKVIILTLAVLLSPTLLTAQQTAEWSRVYTFDESVIDINTTRVVTLFGERGHVTFRWSFARDEPLSAGSRVRYRSRLEVAEYDCTDKRYRPLQVTFLNSAGKVVHAEEMNPPLPWRDATSSIITEKLFNSACQFITPVKRLLATAPGEPGLEDVAAMLKAKKLARSFSEQLERKKDFAPLVKEFFAPRFLNGYLRDAEVNWFLVLNRDVAAQAPRAGLQRYYIALLNFGYLSNLYFASQLPQLRSDPNESPTDEEIIPPAMVNLIRHHPYLSAYQRMNGKDDSAAQNIDSLERLRRYTDLMEKLGALLRRKVMEVRVEKKEKYVLALEDLRESLAEPEISVCQKECFGLPAGTKLFQVNAPVFRLQLAEINGQMKVVSAMPDFQ